MSTDSTAEKIAEHDAKVKGGGDKLQAQSEQKLHEMSGSVDKGSNEEENEESKPRSALDDQPDDPDPS